MICSVVAVEEDGNEKKYGRRWCPKDVEIDGSKRVFKVPGDLPVVVKLYPTEDVAFGETKCTCGCEQREFAVFIPPNLYFVYEIYSENDFIRIELGKVR